MKRLLFMALAFAAVFGCSFPDMHGYRPEIVVEGWIEDGGYPVVIVTTTVPVTDEFKEWGSLNDHVVRWAKVTVSDGEREEVLTGKMDKDYFPPYVYTTARIKGEAGKKYTLTVEYSGRTVTAETTVPAPVPLEWLRVEPSDNGNVSIRAGLRDDPQTKDYYKFFTKIVHKDSVYTSSFMGLINDEILQEDVSEIVVRGAFSPEFGSSDSSVYYSCDDCVMVRFSTLDYASFCYWEDFEDILTLSRNPFFPVSKKVRSNVSSGYGYWAGYGSSYYKVSIPDSLSVH